MGSVRPPTLVYTGARRDAGKRTLSLCREPTPDQKRSVLLAAPQQVEPGASRVGCAQLSPEAPVSPRLPCLVGAEEECAMQVVHPICCGIDVHQAQLTACLRRVDMDGQVTKEVREFATTYDALLTFSTWLTEQQCSVVAMESTGVYWRPGYHVLEGTVEVLVGNAQEMRRRPGAKTDKADARWIAELLAHGLIRPSFIPPPPLGALRDLTRTRVVLIQTRAQAKNRVIKVLEDTTLKLTSVVTDLFGRSGRRMLAALIAGERDPKQLAALALGVLRRKLPQLALALTGQFTEHHAWLIQGALDLIDLLNRQLTDLDQHIGELVTPLAPQMEQLISIPG